MYNKCNHIILIIFSILLTVLFSANTSQLELPKIEEYKLDNGMRILISPNYDYPTFYCHLFINSGEIYDTLYGGSLSDMMYWSMFDGTTKYPTKIKIREKIRELGDDGGRLNTRIMDDVECEMGNYFLKEDIKPALELYAEIIQNPTFPMKDKFWEKIIVKLLPKGNFYNYWNLSNMHLRDLYINHKSKIHPKFIKKVKRQDIQNWHKSIIQPEKTTLMITGDVNYLYVKKIINDYFGDWKSLTAFPKKPEYKTNINDASGNKIRFVNIIDQPDAEIRIIVRSASIDEDWYFSSELAKTVFGWGSLGRLATIHEKLNKYGELKQKSSRTLPFNWTRIEGNINYNNLSTFYELITSEFNKMSSRSISEGDLISAKKIRSNEMKSNLSEPESYTKFIQRAYNINGFSLEKIEVSFDKINNVSLDEINNAASKIYDPNNFILLVMGNQDSCATFLEQFDDVEYYEQVEELRASASSP